MNLNDSDKADHSYLIEENKKVSFVIPIFQTERYLENCIKSLLSQDYKNIEIICVADGKSRQAEHIFKKLQKEDKRLILYTVIKHAGAPAARNEGYKYTTGDYVSFWDSDCYAETGMVRMWIKYFKMFPEISFAYSGYRFNDGNNTYLASNPFDPYLLTCGNYIATMFPMKREIFPGFDPNLQSLQDWDLWLTLSEKGYKGAFIEGSGFTTEHTKGISYEGCSKDNWMNRYNTVRDKHNIKGRDVCFASFMHKKEGIDLAEMNGQDFSNTLGMLPYDYKIIWVIGFYPDNMEDTAGLFRNCPKGCIKVLHFTGMDVECLYNLSYKGIKTIVSLLKGVINKFFVEYETSRKMLKEIGIEAEVLPIPIKYKQIKMPEKFRVYYEYDNTTQEFIDKIKKACPDIIIDDEGGGLEDYACFLCITQSSAPSETFKKFAAAGRGLVTNLRMPYSGHIEIKDLNKSKKEIIEKIRLYNRLFKQGKPIEDIDKQTNYWKEQINSDKMKGIIDELKKTTT